MELSETNKELKLALKHAVAILEQVDFSNQPGLDYDSVNWKLLEKVNVADLTLDDLQAWAALKTRIKG